MQDDSLDLIAHILGLFSLILLSTSWFSQHFLPMIPIFKGFPKRLPVVSFRLQGYVGLGPDNAML